MAAAVEVFTIVGTLVESYAWLLILKDEVAIIHQMINNGNATEKYIYVL